MTALDCFVSPSLARILFLFGYITSFIVVLSCSRIRTLNMFLFCFTSESLLLTRICFESPRSFQTLDTRPHNPFVKVGVFSVHRYGLPTAAASKYS